MDRAWTAHLVSTAPDRLKVQEPEYLLHGDLGAQSVEIDPGHSLSLAGAWSKRRTKEDRSVPSSI
jgi:hypothetical protein